MTTLSSAGNLTVGSNGFVCTVGAVVSVVVFLCGTWRCVVHSMIELMLLCFCWFVA